VTSHPLDAYAAEIATEHLLKGASLVTLGEKYGYSASTLHRHLKLWLAEDRFGMVDKVATGTNVSVIGANDRLEEALSKRTNFWRVEVVDVKGAEGAFTDHYLSPDQTPAAQAAFRAGDELHRALGRVAGDILLNRLRRGMTLALASGRGVGFTVSALEQQAAAYPSRVAGFESLHIVSLCGGGHVSAWATPIHRGLDADENVFVLGAVLGIRRSQLKFMGSWIAAAPARASSAVKRIDLALVGLGQLSARHHFFFHYDQVELGLLSEPVKTIRQQQLKDPSLLEAIGEIGHVLFLTRDVESDAVLDAVRAINQHVVATAPAVLRDAPESILVAGGAQKVPALAALAWGKAREAPIHPENTILVTDSWTARQILERQT
jgi:DNA-binding transcriptional regulator LsrR (DeoR family)